MKHLQGCYGFTLEIQLWNLFGNFLTYHPLRLRPGGFLGFATSERTRCGGCGNSWWIQAPRASRLRPFWRLRRPTGTFLPESRKIKKRTTPMFRWLLAVESNSHVYDQARATHFEMTAVTRWKDLKSINSNEPWAMGRRLKTSPTSNVSGCLKARKTQTRMRLWPINIQYLSKILVVQSK